MEIKGLFNSSFFYIIFYLVIHFHFFQCVNQFLIKMSKVDPVIKGLALKAILSIH